MVIRVGRSSGNPITAAVSVMAAKASQPAAKNPIDSDYCGAITAAAASRNPEYSQNQSQPDRDSGTLKIASIVAISPWSPDPLLSSNCTYVTELQISDDCTS